MKKFIVSVLFATVFSIGLGALVEKAGANFKSDEKALALIKQARLAIGGEQSIAEVRSMVIKAKATITLKADGGARTEQGETEIALQLPNQLSKMVKIGRSEGGDGEQIVGEKHDVIVIRGGGHEADGPGEKTIIIRKADGGKGEIEEVIVNGGGEKAKRITVEAGAHGDHGAMRQNELLRLTLSLLATPPAGMDVNYTFRGETDVDGTACNVVAAEFAGSVVTLYLSKASSLPTMVSYQGHAMPTIMKFRSKAPAAGEPMKDKVIFDHKIEAPAMAEVQVRFADYRSVNGVQLPYRWTTSVGGQPTEVLDVTSYEINPANIAERFQDQKVFVRTPKLQ